MFGKILNRERVRFEDALKHLYNCEYQKRTATILSLAGALSLKQKKVLSLVSKMEKENLLKISNDGLELKPFGRARALQIIRAHRLWESYLADHTGIPLSEIHKQADKKEHSITPDQMAKLEEKLGFPTHDPHGDPIPTADYDMEESHAKPLTDWPKGKLARIVHIEDEPQTVYAQILAEGFTPDTCVKVLESSAQGLLIWTNLHEGWIAPIIAANIYVEEAPEWMENPDVELCSDLKPGEKGKILFLKEQGAARNRFLDLGIVPGTIIQAAMQSALKEPNAYIIRDTMVALRKEQADRILIQRIAGEDQNDAKNSKEDGE